MVSPTVGSTLEVDGVTEGFAMEGSAAIEDAAVEDAASEDALGGGGTTMPAEEVYH